MCADREAFFNREICNNISGLPSRRPSDGHHRRPLRRPIDGPSRRPAGWIPELRSQSGPDVLTISPGNWNLLVRPIRALPTSSREPIKEKGRPKMGSRRPKMGRDSSERTLRRYRKRPPNVFLIRLPMSPGPRDSPLVGRPWPYAPSHQRPLDLFQFVDSLHCLYTTTPFGVACTHLGGRGT